MLAHTQLTDPSESVHCSLFTGRGRKKDRSEGRDYEKGGYNVIAIMDGSF